MSRFTVDRNGEVSLTAMPTRSEIIAYDAASDVVGPTVTTHGIKHRSAYSVLGRRSDNTRLGFIVAECLDACIETRANQHAVGTKCERGWQARARQRYLRQLPPSP